MKNTLTVLLLLILSFAMPVSAGGVYQEPEDFITQVFDGSPPKAKILWLSTPLKKQITSILDHKYRGLRVRYWQDDAGATARTAWVLEEIGKEKMITTGIVINRGHIELVKILVFRESRGWEVRHDFFTDQFKQAQLDEEHGLTKTIDNISGATLSVRAVRKLAQIALLLDGHIRQTDPQIKASL